MNDDLEREADRLLREWSKATGTPLRSVGILNHDRQSQVARREVPMSAFEPNAFPRQRRRPNA